MSNQEKEEAPAREAMLELSHRIYQVDSLVATTAAAAQSQELDRINIQYALEITSKLLLEIASDVEFVGRRMQWAPKAEGTQT